MVDDLQRCQSHQLQMYAEPNTLHTLEGMIFERQYAPVEQTEFLPVKLLIWLNIIS